MIALGLLFLRLLYDRFKPRRQLEAEILALRHQVNVLRQRAPRRLHLRPETVVRWHRTGFPLLATEIPSARGRPQIGKEVRDLIRRMSFENRLWGAPKIHGELLIRRRAL